MLEASWKALEMVSRSNPGLYLVTLRKSSSMTSSTATLLWPASGPRSSTPSRNGTALPAPTSHSFSSTCFGKGLRGGDTPLPKHVEEKLWDVGAGKAVPLRDGVDDLGPEAGHSSVAVEDVMDELFRNVTRYNPGFERETISRAFQLASSMHGDQLRASGESFILHPLGTALICAELRLDSAPSRLHCCMMLLRTQMWVWI